MEFNAFSGGVEPGGLLNESDIRLLLCYMLNGVNAPMNKSSILYVIQANGLANYFESASALNDLCEAGNLEIVEPGNDPAYRITPIGAQVSKSLAQNLPTSVRTKALNAAVTFLSHQRQEKENHVDFVPLEKGVQVNCHISDGETDMMELKLRVPDQAQAEQVRRRFLDNPFLFYSVFIALLTGDPALVSDLRQELDRLK